MILLLTNLIQVRILTDLMWIRSRFFFKFGVTIIDFKNFTSPVFRIYDILVWIRIRILDPDSAIFVIDLQDANKKLVKKKFCLLLFECTFTSFFKEKIQIESQNCRNQSFSYYFCMMIEGSGSRAGYESGSIPLTDGSRSRRPKNMWIRWIRIRNTATISTFFSPFLETFGHIYRR
jgi:hypothetical protein